MDQQHLTSPASYRLASMAQNVYEMPLLALEKAHDSHPSLGHLVLLVFEAVLEVVCISLPGYVIARLGHFDAEKQKFLANLNVMLFTPCLSMYLLHILSPVLPMLTSRSLHQASIAA